MSDQTWYGNDNRLRLLLMTAASISRSTCGCLRPTWRFASGSSWAWMLTSRYPGASCRHPERRRGPRCFLHLWLRQHYPALWEKTRLPILAFQTTYSISLSRDSARSSTWSPTAISAAETKFPCNPRWNWQRTTNEANEFRVIFILEIAAACCTHLHYVINYSRQFGGTPNAISNITVTKTGSLRIVAFKSKVKSSLTANGQFSF